ncbi:TUDOR/PWWP/MBT SUPERFAMILY PROTEIN [Salix viminalis]|uniref:TUDOR/PWWP/MBT SUPERFAMILY PROTEIN n=1 Tax=Salix viminalis TaxID=40686 RepID=A0A9Q0TYT9_SALVM|nr:TUDOR/PWWP/MBT SUPERFAMILY PROTEIN [Salix viminalis]
MPKQHPLCTETDTQLMDVGGNVIASNKESLNSKTELEDLAESDQQSKVEEGLDEGASQGPFDIVSNTGQEMTIEEHFLDAEQVDLQGQEMEVAEQDIDTEQPNTMEDKSSTMPVLRPGISEKEDQACYLLPPDNEVDLSVSDLVWGKVRSHPWWPGQIFDPSDASEKAMRYHKRDCYFVAYFGDRTFAWNEASLLKPFRSHFSQVEKQSNSEVFQNAVGCALEEVSRRVELGLACSCVPKDDYDEIKCQVVENAGIRPEASIREGVDKDTSADSFQPDKLVDYMKALARSPAGGANRLEFVIAKSQLLAFYRLKGYSELPEYQFCGGLLEKSDALLFEDGAIDHTSAVYGDHGQISSGEEILQTQRGSSHKRKHNLKDSIYPSKKEKYLSDLISDSWDSVDDEIGSDRKANSILVSPSGKKRKGPDTFADDASTTGRRNTISFRKSCNSPKVDGSGDGLVGDGSDASFLLSEDAEIKRMIVPTEYSSLDDLLSQLHLTAQDPFERIWNSVVMDQHDKVGGKRKTSQSSGGFPETFEFEDMNDTYWTDRFWINPVAGQTLGNNILIASMTYQPSKPAGYVDEKAPAELVMHFPVVDSVPSEISLNKMFRRFGPLKESETEVDRDTNRARVIFKRCSDAEAAYGSAPKFNIFGPILVNYQLNYSISVPFKTPPLFQDEEDATLFLQY